MEYRCRVATRSYICRINNYFLPSVLLHNKFHRSNKRLNYFVKHLKMEIKKGNSSMIEIGEYLN